MAHLHTGPGEHDLTVSAFIVREAGDGPRLLLHRHKTLGFLLQPGGHVELDENPWAAMLREVAEETGYRADELSVLQPALRVADAMGRSAILHPQPVSLLTHDFDRDGRHRHTDIGFAFVADAEPGGVRAPGESDELLWVSAAELAVLEGDPENVRQVAGFVLGQALAAWEMVPTSSFAVVSQPRRE